MNNWKPIADNEYIICCYFYTGKQTHKKTSQKHRFYELHCFLWLNKKEVKLGWDSTILLLRSGIPGSSVEKEMNICLFYAPIKPLVWFSLEKQLRVTYELDSIYSIFAASIFMCFLHI